MNWLEEAHILFANKTADSMLLNDNSLFFHNNAFLNYFFEKDLVGRTTFIQLAKVDGKRKEDLIQ